MDLKPFGPGGAELGMTRAEMLDRIDYLESAEMAGIEFQTEVMFAWLVAMFFIAHRLSRTQFLACCLLFSLICLWNYMNIWDNMIAFTAWQYLAGFHPVDPESLWDQMISVFLGGYWMKALMALGTYVACIWFSVSCRRNQANTIGSPF